MKLLLLSFFFFSSAAMARLNFIESHLLRLSTTEAPSSWLSPAAKKVTPDGISFTLFGSGHKNVLKVYDDLKSDDEDKLTERLADSFGKPYDLSARIGFSIKKGPIRQSVNTNGGAVLSVTDPVFPELRGMIFHDYSGITSYEYVWKNITIVPRLGYGVRRFIRGLYTVGDIISENVDVKFNEVPYVFYAEAGTAARIETAYGDTEILVNSLPLKNDLPGYWDTYLGYRTPDFLKHETKSLNLFLGYSPIYGGEYDVSRTARFGASSVLGPFQVDVFSLDRFYPGALVAFDWDHFRIAIHTLERSYDERGDQRSRQYGFELTGRF